MTIKKFKSEIIGHLDIIVTENEDELDGDKMQWKEVLIHGNPHSSVFATRMHEIV